MQRQLIVPANIGARIGNGSRSSRWRGLGRHQRHVLAAERTVDIRLLPVVGDLEHVVAHEAERLAHIEARRRDMMHQRGGERAVLAVAVGGGGAGLGRIRDQRVRRRRLDLGETAADRAHADLLHGLAEGVVAACIQNHQPQLLGGFDRNQHTIERDGFVINIGVAPKRSVDRDQIVGALDLDAMTGIVDHGHVGIARLVAEVPQRAAHLGFGQIVTSIDHIEPGLLHDLGEGRRVIVRIGQLRNVPVLRVADDECHAGRRPGRLTDQPHRRDKQKSEQIEISSHGHGGTS